MVSNDVGKKGEDIACRYLEGKGHVILERNFKVKSGEIDIISKKKGRLFFVEVKATSQEDKGLDTYQKPEESVHSRKMKKLSRAVQVYLAKRYDNLDVEWDFMVIAMDLDIRAKTARVRVISDVLA